MIRLLFVTSILFCSIHAFSQVENGKAVPKSDYQIFLKQPAKEIKLLMYEKNFLPIQGKLSEDHKSIIMKNYENGSKVHVKVIYDDGTEEDFIKSPCYIDPVIT
ncbi:MAG: hypothetical protein ABI763_13165 [Bacteroidota bacterium]